MGVTSIMRVVASTDLRIFYFVQKRWQYEKMLLANAPTAMCARFAQVRLLSIRSMMKPEILALAATGFAA